MKNISLFACSYFKLGLEWFPQNEEDSGGFELNANATDEQVVNMLDHIMMMHSHTIPEFINADADKAYELLLDLMHKYLLKLDGHIVFTDDNGDRIFTGCCFSLYGWKKTVRRLNRGISTWMGHDPYVNLQIVDGKWIITNRSEENSYPNGKDIDICYEKKEFKSLLAKLEKELEEFTYGPLKSAVSKIWPTREDEFCKAFYRQFTEPDLSKKSRPYIDKMRAERKERLAQKRLAAQAEESSNDDSQ